MFENIYLAAKLVNECLLRVLVCTGRSEFYDRSNKQIIAHKRKWCFFARKWNVKTGGPWVVLKNMHTKYKQNVASSNIFFSISCSNIYKYSFQRPLIISLY